MKRITAIIAVLVGIALTFLIWTELKEKTPASGAGLLLSDSKAAPVISLMGLDGISYTFPKADKKPLVLFFWASWCPGCNSEAPEMVKFKEKYEGKLQIYGVNMTHLDTIKDASRFTDKYAIPFPILMDKQGEASDAYKVTGTPTTVFIDKNGNIQDRSVGFPNLQELENKILKLIETTL